MLAKCIVMVLFLLTPLREGRHADLRDADLRDAISTHAPARGATFQLLQQRRQHVHFYSRPCERGDPPLIFRRGGWYNISTHAPARGATTGIAMADRR